MFECFDHATLPATPWKNGGGNTREVVCRPQHAGMEAFDWRVSIATIAQSGPFSVFPGIDRCILLLSGGGVTLQSASGMQHQLDQLDQPFAFSGDVAMECTLLAGTSTDFNVMTRRGVVRSSVNVHRSDGSLKQTSAGVLLAMEGDWQLADETKNLALTQGQGLWWDGPTHAWQLSPLSPQARLISVSIEPMNT